VFDLGDTEARPLEGEITMSRQAATRGAVLRKHRASCGTAA